MRAIFAIWQLQGTIPEHFGNPILQVANAQQGAIFSHAGNENDWVEIPADGTVHAFNDCHFGSEEFLPDT